MKEHSQIFKNRVLCFGDSNTYGFIPGTNLRYDDETRWTAILQKDLGNEYTVIEEGLNGRTSGFDEEDGILPERLVNGLKVTRFLICSHRPIDLVIIMLGANDIKKGFNATPQNVVDNLMNIITVVKEYGVYNNKSPKVILCTLPYLHDKVQDVWEVFKGRLGLVIEINKLIKQIKSEGVYIFNLYEITQDSSEDGAHLSPESHLILGKEMTKFIKSCL